MIYVGRQVNQASPRDYNDVIMRAMECQITSSAALAFVRRIHRWPMNSPHKGPVTRKRFPFDDVIMDALAWNRQCHCEQWIVIKSLQTRILTLKNPCGLVLLSFHIPPNYQKRAVEIEFSGFSEWREDFRYWHLTYNDRPFYHALSHMIHTDLRHKMMAYIKHTDIKDAGHFHGCLRAHVTYNVLIYDSIW